MDTHGNTRMVFFNEITAKEEKGDGWHALISAGRGKSL